jgi:hypothetical protein
MRIRPVAVALLAALALCAHGDSAEPYVFWVDRAVARPWLPALEAAAKRTDLPVALVGELIGAESGFKNIHNPHSSAAGFGQQIARNAVMLKYNLHPMRPPESILGAALELRERLDANGGDLNRALKGYGTTSGMAAARRKQVEARFAEAANRIAGQMVAQQVAPIVGELHLPKPL